MAQITVLPSGQSIEVTDKSNLRDSLLAAGLPIKSTCGGCASCGQCVVIIKDGFDCLSDISFEEKQLLGNVFHITQERLSCQTEVLGDLTVDISQHLESKPKPKTMRRSKQEAEQVITDRKEKAKERPQRQGGNKRPRAFKTN